MMPIIQKTFPAVDGIIGGKNVRNDLSITGWNVMALKSARLAGLDVGQGLARAYTLYQVAWRAANQFVNLVSSRATLPVFHIPTTPTVTPPSGFN